MRGRMPRMVVTSHGLTLAEIFGWLGLVAWFGLWIWILVLLCRTAMRYNGS